MPYEDEGEGREERGKKRKKKDGHTSALVWRVKKNNSSASF